MTVEQEFKTLRELVLHVLEIYPETRNNDTLLYLKCNEIKGNHTLDDIRKDENRINMISVHKLRQRLQNKEHLFVADESVKANRKKREVEIRDYMRKTS